MPKRIIFLFMILLVVLSACGSGKHEISNERKTRFEKMNFVLPDTTMVQCFTVSEEGDIYVLDWEGVLRRYGADGTVKDTLSGEETEGTTAMLCVGNELYLAQQNNARIRAWNTDTKEVKTVISTEFEGGNIRDMVAADGIIYVLTEGKLISVNTVKYEVVVLPVTDISAIYGGTDGKLYYCEETSTKKAIYCYDSGKCRNGTYEQNEPLYEMTDILPEDSIRAFVLENDYLVYAPYTQKRVNILKLSDSLTGTVQENATVFYGRDMRCIAGNVVYYRSGMTSEEMGFENFYIPDITLEGQRQENSENNKENSSEQNDAHQPINPQPAGLSGTIKIAAIDNSYNFYNVNKIGNIKAELYEDRFDNYKTELLAGDDNFDIYILNYSDLDVQELMKAGYFVPLNSSLIISDYCDKCFDYVEEAVTAENGDIFALPLTISTNVVWYVPENFEKNGLNVADLDDLEHYMQLSVKSREYDEQGITSYAGSFVAWLDMQYAVYFNDYSNGIVNFKTDFYYDFFEKMWKGWFVYQNSTHPMLNEAMEDEDYNYYKADSVTVKNDRVLFVADLLWNEDITLHAEEGWRVKGMPKLSEKCNQNLVSGVCAMINPASKNKELAMAYLETIAANPSCAINLYTDLFFEDKSVYENRRYFMKDANAVYEYTYDMSSSVMSDLYDIFKNGRIAYTTTSNLYNIADDYQNGRYTLEEAVDELQREVEMWLME